MRWNHWLWILVLLISCDGPGRLPRDTVARSSRGLVFLNEAKNELNFSAVFHKANAEEGTWHLIVDGEGDMASRAFFTTEVSPGKFYESLKAIGAVDGNNVSSANFSEADVATQGDVLEFLLDWKGQKEPVPLTKIVKEVVPDLPSSGGERGLEMRFGGNYTGEDAAAPPCHSSGCLACLYTCSAGVTSNARANNALLKKERGVHRYRLNPSSGLEDGARVRVFVRKK